MVNLVIQWTSLGGRCRDQDVEEWRWEICKNFQEHLVNKVPKAYPQHSWHLGHREIDLCLQVADTKTMNNKASTALRAQPRISRP